MMTKRINGIFPKKSFKSWKLYKIYVHNYKKTIFVQQPQKDLQVHLDGRIMKLRSSMMFMNLTEFCLMPLSSHFQVHSMILSFKIFFLEFKIT
jgi:hypothetical protein